MSTESSTPGSTPPATPSTPTTPASNAAPSLINPAAAAPAAEAAPATEWTEYVPDQSKTDAENAALKADHDAKKPAAAPAAPTVLTAADIKLPEGFEVDEPTMNEFLGIQNDPKLTPAERSQKLIDLQIKASQEGLEKATQAWETRMTDWQTEVRNDPTVGGARFEQSVATANKVVQQYGSPELAQLLADTGAGNNLHLVKFLNAIAPKLLEPAPVKPGGPTGAQPSSAAERMYPSMKK